jgi:hypothetical protein
VTYISLQDETTEYYGKQDTYGREDEEQQSVVVFMCGDVIEIISDVVG